MFKRFAMTALLVLAVSVGASAADYNIDGAHSSIDFSVRHLAISKIKGSFNSFEGTITIDPADSSKWSCEAIIQVATVDSRNESRDKHLRSPDFFDAEKYPTMTFKSTKTTPKGHGHFAVVGDFTMHGVTKPVTLNVELLGMTADGSRAGFSATGTIDRTEYGMSYGKVLETGGLMIGHDIEVSLELEATLAE